MVRLHAWWERRWWRCLGCVLGIGGIVFVGESHNQGLLTDPQISIPSLGESFTPEVQSSATTSGVPLTGVESEIVNVDPVLPHSDWGILQDPPPSGLDNSPYLYSRSTFRQNLARIAPPPTTGGPYDAHHVFPQKILENYFAGKVDIHDPKYGRWVPADIHKAEAKDYNAQWEVFLAKERTAFEIIRFGLELSKGFGYDNP